MGAKKNYYVLAFDNEWSCLTTVDFFLSSMFVSLIMHMYVGSIR